MNEPILYHIAKAEAWASAQSAGTYCTPDLPQVGFIHLCTPAQLPFVRHKFFPITTGFLLLHIDPTKLTAPLKYETSEPDQPPFPHLYGPLNTDALLGVKPLP